MLLVQTHRQVIRDLASGRDNHTVRILQFENIHYTFECQLIEVKAVAHIVVGRNRFRVVVDHNRAPTLLADRVERLHTAPVELYRATDTVSTRTQHHDGAFISQIMHIAFRSVVSQVQIVGLCRIFGSQRIDLFHHRKDAAVFTVLTNLKDRLFTVFHLIFEDSTGNLEIRETLLLRQTEQIVGDINYPAETFQSSCGLDNII